MNRVMTPGTAQRLGSEFAPGAAPHELGHGLGRAQMAVEQGHRRLGDGHVHAQGLRALHHGAGAVDAFGHMAQGFDRLRQRLALCQQHAHAPDAREVAGGEPSVVVDAVLKGQGNFGFNAANDTYGDMIEMASWIQPR